MTGLRDGRCAARATVAKIGTPPALSDRAAAVDDRAYFFEVRVHPALRTLGWPNGADVDPDVLLGAQPPA